MSASTGTEGSVAIQNTRLRCRLLKTVAALAIAILLSFLAAAFAYDFFRLARPDLWNDTAESDGCFELRGRLELDAVALLAVGLLGPVEVEDGLFLA